MYSTKQITELVEEKISDTETFIVEIKILNGNKIQIYLDSKQGITIDDCVDISRYVESNLNRESEDFEMEVSSAGIGSPFKVEEQYKINLGKEVEVLINTGEKTKGVLKTYKDNTIELEIIKKIKTGDKKKKQTIKEIQKIKIDTIKSTKLML